MDDSDKIKNAFLKVKEDMNSLENEISSLKSEVLELKYLLKNTSTIQHSNPTLTVNPTDTSTVPQEAEGLKNPNLDISIGNEGVPTDRQTDTSTDNSTHKSIESSIKEASEILDSLDNLKKQIRLKFKRITPQEMAVFSSIYQLEEQKFHTLTYKKVATTLQLSESSIRDYVQRLITKGIPIKKTKVNNRQVILSISPDLKKIASLSTIIQLREL